MSPRPNYHFQQHYADLGLGRALVVVKYDSFTMWAYGIVDTLDVTDTQSPLGFVTNPRHNSEYSQYPKIAFVLNRARWKLGLPPRDVDEAERMSRDVSLDATPEKVALLREPQKSLPAKTDDVVDAEVESASESDTPDYEIES